MNPHILTMVSPAFFSQVDGCPSSSSNTVSKLYNLRHASYCWSKHSTCSSLVKDIFLLLMCYKSALTSNSITQLTHNGIIILSTIILSTIFYLYCHIPIWREINSSHILREFHDLHWDLNGVRHSLHRKMLAQDGVSPGNMTNIIDVSWCWKLILTITKIYVAFPAGLPCLEHSNYIE